MGLAVPGIRTLVASTVLAFLAASADSVAIASTMSFQTTGTVGSTGVTGASVVHFVGTSDGSLTTGASFDLGRFVVDPLPAGAATTYRMTPFQVAFTPRSVNGQAISDTPPVVLQGYINGTIGGGGTSGVSFWVDRMAYPLEETPKFPSYVPPFRTGNLLDSIFDAPGASNWLQPSASGSSIPLRAVIQAETAPSPVPEPGSLAIFGWVVAVLAIRRYLA